MAERRTLGDALTMSPEKLAFIKGDGSQEALSRPKRDPVERTIDLVSTSSNEAKEPEPLPARTRARRQSPRAEPAMPNASEVLDDLLVPLTTRLPHRLVQSLRRVCLEQRLRHAKPDSIQEIVETAIQSWLAKQ